MGRESAAVRARDAARWASGADDLRYAGRRGAAGAGRARRRSDFQSHMVAQRSGARVQRAERRCDRSVRHRRRDRSPARAHDGRVLRLAAVVVTRRPAAGIRHGSILVVALAPVVRPLRAGDPRSRDAHGASARRQERWQEHRSALVARWRERLLRFRRRRHQQPASRRRGDRSGGAGDRRRNRRERHHGAESGDLDRR